MRQTLSWIVILLLILPVGSVELEGIENGPNARTLRQRLRDMPAEAACFSNGLPESGRPWLPAIDVQQTVTEDEAEVARLRVRIRQLSPGTEITIVLRDGSRLQGEIADTDRDAFRLVVPHPATRGAKQTRSFRYEEIESADLPEAKGWSPAEKIPQYGKGRRIDVLLVDGTLLQGRLSHVAGKRFGLEVDDKQVREYSLDEVASVRTRGMPTHAKVWIAIGAAVGVLLGIQLALCAGPGCD
jgi:hypothetical protein